MNTQLLDKMEEAIKTALKVIEMLEAEKTRLIAEMTLLKSELAKREENIKELLKTVKNSKEKEETV